MRNFSGLSTTSFLYFLLCSTDAGAVAFSVGLMMIIFSLRERSMFELLELEIETPLSLSCSFCI